MDDILTSASTRVNLQVSKFTSHLMQGESFPAKRALFKKLRALYKKLRALATPQGKACGLPRWVLSLVEALAS